MLARTPIIFSSLFVILAYAAQSANAAPQILGLLATKVPQPMACNGDVCSADLASFCLQPKRGEPWPGQRYHAANANKFQLVVQTADGDIRTLKAQSHVRFQSNVAMTAVRAYVKRNFLAGLGARSISLQIRPGAVLLPAATKDDPDPITPDEIAAATGRNRSMGAAYFENGGPVGVRARLTAALLSATPVSGKLTRIERARLWRDAVTPELKQVSTPAGIAMARAHLDACHWALDEGTHYSMRSCLEFRHETYMWKQNDMLRRALKAGW